MRVDSDMHVGAEAPRPTTEERRCGLGKLFEEYAALPVQVRASLWSFVCGVLQRGVQVIVTPIFTRLLSAAEYGDYTNFTSWLDIFALFLTLRLSWGVFMQGLVRYDDDNDLYTSSLIGLTTFIELLGLVLYLPWADYWNAITGLTTMSTLAIFVVSWTTSLFGFWQTRQRVVYRYRALLLLTLAMSVAQPVAGILAVLAFPEHKVEARVASMALVQLLCYGWIFLLYWSRGRKLYARKHWKHALRFNIPLLPHYLSQSLLGTSDRIMIRNMISSAAAGIYGLSYSISFLMTILNQALINTLNPWIYQQIKAKNYDDLAHVSYLVLTGVAAANLFVVALAPEAMAFFAPAEYQEGIWIMPPLVASVVVTFMYSLFACFEFYYERTDLVMWASIVGAVLNIGLNLVLIPKCGYQIAAWTTLAGYVVYVGMHYAFMRQVQRIEMENQRVYNPAVLLAILGTFGVACAALMLLYPMPLARLTICGIGVAFAIVKREAIISAWKRLRA